MILYTVSVDIRQGKASEALDFAKAHTDYVNKQILPKVSPDHHVEPIETWTPMFGQVRRVAWTFRLGDLAALEAFNKVRYADEGYQKSLKESADLLVTSSLKTNAYSLME